MSYQFKVGDTVKHYNQSIQYVIAEISDRGFYRSVVGSGENSWMPHCLELVCPAGYRPVREDEMDQCPIIGDVWVCPAAGLVEVRENFSKTFRAHQTNQPDKILFRPISTPEPVKEDRNWISWYSDTDEDGEERHNYCDELTHAEALEEATLAAKAGHPAFVARIHGKFVPSGVKWVPNE